MDRSSIIQEYFQLIISLNKGNKLKNEKTTIQLAIEPYANLEYRLLAQACGISENNKIEISRRNRRGHWERSGFTSFQNLENYCAQFLNTWEGTNKPSPKNSYSLTSSQLVAMNQNLQKEFMDLLINQRP